MFLKQTTHVQEMFKSLQMWWPKNVVPGLVSHSTDGFCWPQIRIHTSDFWTFPQCNIFDCCLTLHPWVFVPAFIRQVFILIFFFFINLHPNLDSFVSRSITKGCSAPLWPNASDRECRNHTADADFLSSKAEKRLLSRQETTWVKAMDSDLDLNKPVLRNIHII